MIKSATTSCRNRGFSLVEILVVVGIIVLLTAIVLPAMQMVRGRARAAGCASNLRQIGLAMPMYAADYNNKFPHVPEGLAENCSWASRFDRYLPDPGVFSCPAAVAGNYIRGCPPSSLTETDGFGGRVNYDGSYDLNLLTSRPINGVSEARFTHPTTTISALDGNGQFIFSFRNDMSKPEDVARAGVNKPRHHGGYNVLYLDGHVKWMSESGLLDPLLWAVGNSVTAH